MVYNGKALFIKSLSTPAKCQLGTLWENKVYVLIWNSTYSRHVLKSIDFYGLAHQKPGAMLQ